MKPPVMTTSLAGLGIRRQGKVRDIYDLGDSLLLVATDRISAFDVVMAEPIPDKGRILTRLSAWQDAGLQAQSGVETFYHPTVDAAERDDAVATMIFNVWISDLLRETLDDEHLPGGAFQGGGSAGRLRVLDRMYKSRGENNPLGLAAYNPATEESVFFDDLRTPGTSETSDEIALRALTISLDFLESASTGPGEGGFATADMDAWLWGLRHQVEFGSLVGSYVDDPLLGAIFDRFAIDTERLPLAPDLASDDPRARLEWFPRPGDNRNPDGCNPGFSGRGFRHGSGPVMRMVFALAEGGVDVVTGVNLPMVLRAVQRRVELPVSDLAQDVLAYGRRNITCASDWLRRESGGTP